MEWPVVVALGSFLLLMGVSGFFSLSEAALFSLNPMQVRRLREKNPRFGRPLASLLDRPESVVSVVVLGNTTTYFAATLIGWWILEYFHAGMA